MYSVADAREARALLVLTLNGDFIGPELALGQTVENLEAFSDRLDKGHELMVSHGHCRCKKEA